MAGKHHHRLSVALQDAGCSCFRWAAALLLERRKPAWGERLEWRDPIQVATALLLLVVVLLLVITKASSLSLSSGRESWRPWWRWPDGGDQPAIATPGREDA